MNKSEIPKIAKRSLANLLDEPGGILYSSHETLKPNDVYLLGFNPGGINGEPLSKSINMLLKNTSNAYLDESWENGIGSWEKGEAPLQKRICWLLETLGFNPRNVCASNLIFLQSRKANDISFSLAKQCWPVHEAILEIINPKLIITFGNSNVSPYNFLRSMYNGIEETISSGHGNWKVKGFSTTINNKEVYIAGLPHLSRYDPIGKEKVIAWLRNKL